MAFVYLNMYVVCTCRCVILCEDMHSSSYFQTSTDYNGTHCYITITFFYCIECHLKTNGDPCRNEEKGKGKEEEMEV